MQAWTNVKIIPKAWQHLRVALKIRCHFWRLWKKSQSHSSGECWTTQTLPSPWSRRISLLCTSPQITGDYTWKWKEGLGDRFVGFTIPPAGISNIRAVTAVWEGSGQITDGILNQKNPSLLKHFSWFITGQGNFLLRDEGRAKSDSQERTQWEDGLKSVEFTLIQAFSYIWSAHYTSTEAPNQIKGSELSMEKKKTKTLNLLNHKILTVKEHSEVNWISYSRCKI